MGTRDLTKGLTGSFKIDTLLMDDVALVETSALIGNTSMWPDV